MALTVKQLSDIHYITLEEVYENTGIQKNVEQSELYPYLKISERSYIDDILGEDLSVALKTEIFNVTTGGTLSQRFEDLIEYIKPAEALFVQYSYIGISTYKSTPEGLVKKSDEHFESVSIDEFNAIRKQIESRAYTFLRQLKNYLEANIDDYPEYVSECTDLNKPNNAHNILFY